MGLSKVTINIVQGLGKTAVEDDSVSALVADAVAIDGKLTVGTPMVITSLSQLEALGVTEAWDKTNKVMLWHHASAFYDTAPKGTYLYIMPVTTGTAYSALFSISEGPVKSLLEYAKGKVKLLAAASMSEAPATLAAGIAAAQKLSDYMAARNRPLSILLEGREMPAAADSATDLHESTANRVSVVIGQDADVAAEVEEYASYAAVGLALGTLASRSVNQSLARVKSGAVPVTVAGLSSGLKDGDAGYTEDLLEQLDDKGYILLRSFATRSGYYWNRDYTAAPLTDDCASIRMGRTLDKVVRIIDSRYTEELNEDYEVDASTGYMDAAVVKALQSELYDAVMEQMTGEITDLQIIIDPEQNLITSERLVATVKVVSHGIIANIEVNLMATSKIESND